MNPQIPQRPFLKASEVARIFNVNHSTVFLWVRKGILRPNKTLGGNFRFSRDHIVKLWEKKGEGSQIRNKRKEKVHHDGFVVSLKMNDNTKVTYYSAIITDMSPQGLDLIIENKNGLKDQLAQDKVKEVAILNYQNPLFKEKLTGTIKHYDVFDDGRITMGVSLS
ncbi:MAG: MerR family transcriptional regulator [Chitinivibrionales bacterium]|nr:MerR family transcriptional regulator [Chitinivibrionales bacterium]